MGTPGSLSSVIYGLQIVWIVIAGIVLMNLLIAMMGSTYNSVMQSSEAAWRLQFADLVVLAQARRPAPY